MVAPDAAGELEEHRLARRGSGRRPRSRAPRRCRAAGRMNGPKPGGSPPARIIAAQHSAATSASRAPSPIAATAAAGARPADRRGPPHQRLLLRALHPPQRVDEPRDVAPLGGDRARSRIASPWLRPAVHVSSPIRRPASRRAASTRAARSAAVSLSECPTNSAAVTCRSIVTRSIARVTSTGAPVARHDQQVRREIAPVVEPGQPEDVLRRREDRRLEPARLQLRPHPAPGVIRSRRRRTGSDASRLLRFRVMCTTGQCDSRETPARCRGRQDMLAIVARQVISVVHNNDCRAMTAAPPNRTTGRSHDHAPVAPAGPSPPASPSPPRSPRRRLSRRRRSNRPRPTATSASASPTRRRSASPRPTAS